MVIRCMRGLGDAVYTYPIVKYYEKQNPIVITNYPVVFSSLNVRTTTNYGLSAILKPKYSNLRKSPYSQYKDLLRSVNLNNIPFTFEWNLGFTEEFKVKHFETIMNDWTASHKNLCIIKEPSYAHMEKTKNNGTAVSPNPMEMQKWVDTHDMYYISVGREERFTARLKNIDYDLVDKTSVQDLITLIQLSSMVATQVGHLVPIAQGLSKALKVFYPTDPGKYNLQPYKFEVV